MRRQLIVDLLALMAGACLGRLHADVRHLPRKMKAWLLSSANIAAMQQAWLSRYRARFDGDAAALDRAIRICAAHCGEIAIRQVEKTNDRAMLPCWTGYLDAFSRLTTRTPPPTFPTLRLRNSRRPPPHMCGLDCPCLR